MRRSIMLLSAWMLLPAAAFAGKPLQDWPVKLQLDVNPAGQVIAAKVMDPAPIIQQTGDGHLTSEGPRYRRLPEALARKVEQATLKWRFQPVRFAGIPVTGRTWATALLQFVEREDGNLDVALQYQGNGPFMRYQVLPRYPEPMLRQVVTGVLDVEYVVEPNGSVDHIRVLKAFGEVAQHEEVFEQAVREAFGASKGMPLMVDGKPAATRMRIPVAFFIGNEMSDFDRKRLLKKAWRVLNLGSRKDDSASAPAEAVAVDSQFVLSAG